MPLQEIKRLLIVSDLATPQVNGVVRTLDNLVVQFKKIGIAAEILTPNKFRTIGCPGYPELRLSLTTAKRLESMIRAINPDALHIATEGPLGWAARKAALNNGWQFTTASQTRLPEYMQARLGIPGSWLYKILRKFHSASSAVFAPTTAIKNNLLKSVSLTSFSGHTVLTIQFFILDRFKNQLM